MDNPFEAEQWRVKVESHCFERQRKQNSNVSIYRLPTSIKDCKRDAYEPRVVRLGPLHQQNFLWDKMDQLKVDAIHSMLKRLNDANPRNFLTIDRILGLVSGMKGYICGCYESFTLDREDGLCAMLTLDACFILDFLWEESMNIGSRKAWEIMKDIFKLENQIPLIVLLEILKLGYGEKAKSELAKILYKHPPFQSVPFSFKSNITIIAQQIDGASHLLDLLRKTIQFFLKQQLNMQPTTEHPSTTPSSVELAKNPSQLKMPSSTEHHDIYITESVEALHKVGIVFKPSSNGEVRFEKRWLRRSILYLPQIYLDQDTEDLVRNLMAFEDYLDERKDNLVISQFMMLMDYLVDTQQDVALLRKARIITGRIGSDNDLATIFNTLCKGKGVKQCGSLYEGVVKDIRAHCNSSVKKGISEFKEEYFSKPWHIISLVVATVLLVMAAFQTYYASKSLKP